MQSQLEGLFFLGKRVACFCEMKKKGEDAEQGWDNIKEEHKQIF